MPSAAVLNDPNEMVRQMVSELKFEYGGTERAIEVVARDSGLTYSKTYNLFCRRTFDVWSKQKKELVAAFKQFVLRQERAYRDGAKRFAELNDEIERMERRHGMDSESFLRGVGQLDTEQSHQAR